MIFPITPTFSRVAWSRGLAQINLPPDETIDSVRRKLVLDIEYIETASWGLDAYSDLHIT